MPKALRILRSALCLLGFAVFGARAGGVPDLEAVKTAIRATFPDVRHLAIEDLEAAWMTRALVVDVRRPGEYAVSHLPGAVNLRDPAAIAALARQVPGRPVLVYCSIGYRSAAMARRLARRDVEAWNLEGSIFEWAHRGGELVRDGRRTHEVHPYDRRWGRLLDRAHWPAEGPWAQERPGNRE